MSGNISVKNLYSLKRLGETIRLGLAQNSLNREQLLETYNRRRLQEVEQLLLLQQDAVIAVAFTDTIDTIEGTTLRLNNLILQITAETVINGNLAAGARIQVEAITRPPGSLMAMTLTVIEPAPPKPIFTPTAMPSSTPTKTTSAPTATPTVIKIQTGDTLSLPPTSVDTSMPTPLSTPSPTPTVQITLDANEVLDNTNEPQDDNSNENENENDDKGEDKSDDNSGSNNSGSGSSNSGSGNSQDDH